MDDILIYLLLGLIYLIFSGLTSKKKKKKQVPPPASPPPPGSVAGPTDAPAAQPTLDDALREIRVALGMEPPPPSVPKPPAAQPPPIQAPPRTVTHPTRTHGPELAETAPKKSWPSEFKPHRTHYADGTFEELATRDGDRFGEQRKTPTPRPPAPPPAKPSPAPIQPTQAPTSVRRSRIRHQLNDPNAARDAFILSEIFGPPRAHRRR